MNIRTRKFFGTIGILLTLLLYLPIAMLVGANHFAQASAWQQVLYFLVAGTLWVLPAGAIVRWMVKPDDN
jgi:hypothetical protein